MTAPEREALVKAQSFRKRPVVIQATRWLKNGDHPEDYAKERTGFEGGQITTFSGEHARVQEWEGAVVRYCRHPSVNGGVICSVCSRVKHDHGWIDTLEGGHIVCPGDWIITGVKGERYPCKPDIFEATYEPGDAYPAVTKERRREILVEEFTRFRVEGDGYLAALKSGEAEGTRAFKAAIAALERIASVSAAPAVTVTEEMVERLRTLASAASNAEWNERRTEAKSHWRTFDELLDQMKAALKSTTPQTGSQE